MAAHALTIARQILAQQPDKIVAYARGALSAPGLDCPAMPLKDSFDLWKAIDRAVEANDPDQVRVATKALHDVVLHLDGYASFEDVKKAGTDYIRIGRPHYRTRWEKWDAGDKKAHRAATPGRAPQIAPWISA